jgi:two-component system LytT family response regulator
MKRLRVVIADDEKMARRRLRRLLGERDDCELVGEFTDGVSLAAGLLDTRADLILLDIEMPGQDGFASLANLGMPAPLVIFITAFEEFAKRAFDIDAADYLLKPVSAARLDEAFTRVTRRLLAPSSEAKMVPTAMARFAVQGRVYLFDRSRILSLQALGNYVELTTDTRRVQLRTTLEAAHAYLGDAHFVRVHRSWVVRRTAIAHVTSLSGSRREIGLIDGRRIPGGRAFAQRIGINLLR